MRLTKYYSLFLLVLLIGACSTSEKTIEDVVEEYRDNYEEEALPGGYQLSELRSRLSDVYASRSSEIPEAFSRIKVEEDKEVDLYEGYRVQIYSGQSVDDADSIAADFRVWSDSSLVGYQPETYVFFRTPFYRVHVGDFHSRERAIIFSNMVKRYFRDAWVIHDRVEPAYVPADTVKIELN